MDDDSEEPMILMPKQGLVPSSRILDDDLLTIRVICTACGEQVNHLDYREVRTHLHLSVLTCKKCFEFYDDGNFSRDETGDQYCRWCADGGRLIACDDCTNAFCCNCIRRNLGRKEANEVTNSTQHWSCYRCNPAPIKGHVEFCRRIEEMLIKKKTDQRKVHKAKNKSISSSTLNQNVEIEEILESESEPNWADPLFSQAGRAIDALSFQMTKLKSKYENSKNDPSTIYKCSWKLKRLLSKHNKYLEYLLIDIKTSLHNNQEGENQKNPLDISECDFEQPTQLLIKQSNLEDLDKTVKTKKHSDAELSDSSCTHKHSSNLNSSKKSLTQMVNDVDESKMSPILPPVSPSSMTEIKSRKKGLSNSRNSKGEDKTVDEFQNGKAGENDIADKNIEKARDDLVDSSTNGLTESEPEKLGVNNLNEEEADASSEVLFNGDEEADNELFESDIRESPNALASDNDPSHLELELNSSDEEVVPPTQDANLSVKGYNAEGSLAEKNIDRNKNMEVLETKRKSRKKMDSETVVPNKKPHKSAQSLSSKGSGEDSDRPESSKSTKNIEDSDEDSVSINNKNNSNKTKEKTSSYFGNVVPETGSEDSDADFETTKEKKSSGSIKQVSDSEDDFDIDNQKNKNKTITNLVDFDSDSESSKNKIHIKNKKHVEDSGLDTESKKSDVAIKSIETDNSNSDNEMELADAGNEKAKKFLLNKMLNPTPEKTNKRKQSFSSSSSSSDSDSLKSGIVIRNVPDPASDIKLNSKAVVELQNLNIDQESVVLKSKKKKIRKKLIHKMNGKYSEDSEENVNKMIDNLEVLPNNNKITPRKSTAVSGNDSSDSSNDFQAKVSTPKKGSPKVLSKILISSDSSDESSDDVKIEKEGKSKGPSLAKSRNIVAKEALLFDVSDSTNASDSDVIPLDSDPKKTKGKTGSKPKKNSFVLSDDSSDDFVSSNKYSKYDKILKVPVNEKNKGKNENKTSNGKDEPKNKTSKKKAKRIKIDSDSDKPKSSSSSSQSSDSDSDASNIKSKKTSKKRKRIKKMDNSDDSDVQDTPDTPSSKGRKNIRKLLADTDLRKETKIATAAEKERLERVKARQKLYNQVTEQGGDFGEQITKKLVLEVHPDSKEELVEIPPEIISKLKPHQVNGVKFMWECLIESLSQLENEKNKGSGCVLAHCMGLGKTLQVIAFVSTLLNNKRISKKIRSVLVVCPLNTIRNWSKEFDMWLGNTDADVNVFELADVKTTFERADVLNHWSKDGGVMITSYETFRGLVNGGKKIPKRCRTIFDHALCDPGPDIIICDEGHVLKNESTALSKAMKKIRGQRRVILTGTPLQNNLREYHCMIQFVKPHLVGTKTEFLNRFVNPISNGQCADSTPQDVKLMKKRVHILHKLLEGCVQRCDYSHVTKYLLPKYEFVISVRLSEAQVSLYKFYLNRLSGNGEDNQDEISGRKLFQDYNILKLIWTHPYLLQMSKKRNDLKAFLDDVDDDSMESFINDDSDSEPSSKDSEKEKNDVVCLDDGDSDTKPSTSTGKRRTRKNKPKDDSDEEEVVSNWTTRSRARGVDFEEEEEDLMPKNNQWWNEFVPEEELNRVELSGKMILLFDILKECELLGDKVLLFTTSLLTLDLIEELLQKLAEENRTSQADLPVDTIGTWVTGIDYFRMDGSTSADQRKKWIDIFNQPTNIRARLFMISTKAGSLGTNLIGANRVVMMDASWNPTHDVQAIFRVYRFGQKKPVYIYRLLAQGTMEEKIYDRQVTKQSMAGRVVDEHQIERHFNAADLVALYSFNPESKSNRPTPLVPKDRLLAEMLIKEGVKDLIVTYHEHDSLLENIEEEGLTEDERKVAWAEYEAEKEGLLKQASHVSVEQEFLLEVISEDTAGNLETVLLKIREKRPGTEAPQIINFILQIHALCQNKLKETLIIAANLRKNGEDLPGNMKFNIGRYQRLLEQSKSIVEQQREQQRKHELERMRKEQEFRQQQRSYQQQYQQQQQQQQRQQQQFSNAFRGPLNNQTFVNFQSDMGQRIFKELRAQYSSGNQAFNIHNIRSTQNMANSGAQPNAGNPRARPHVTSVNHDNVQTHTRTTVAKPFVTEVIDEDSQPAKKTTGPIITELE